LLPIVLLKESSECFLLALWRIGMMDIFI